MAVVLYATVSICFARAMPTKVRSHVYWTPPVPKPRMAWLANPRSVNPWASMCVNVVSNDCY